MELWGHPSGGYFFDDWIKHDWFAFSQCAIPAFEGLLPEPHNAVITKLLFRLAEWHALAKLRFHTDSTILYLKSATTVLGKQLREFRSTTCSAFQTCELPKEVAARGRHQAQKQAKVSTTPSQPPTLSKTQPKTVSFNASTYKVHALGDYASTVMMYGPTDSYSTQTVISINTYFVLWANLHLQGELEHRRVKKLYSLTNKNGAIKQMPRHERCETRMRKAQHAFKVMDHRVHPHHIPLTTSDPLPYTDPRDHHHMSKSRRHYRDLFSFAKMYPGDPATKVTSLVC